MNTVLKRLIVGLGISLLCLLAGYGDASFRHCVRPVAAAMSVPLDTALRTVDTVQDFSDYLTVARNRYAADVTKAVELGLVVGKYDAQSSYYDPDTLVTTGEMANILARNLGAERTVQGAAALGFLDGLGVRVRSDPNEVLSLGELQSLAGQIRELDFGGKADLLVLREAISGALSPDAVGGITRAHAVAMYHPSQRISSSADDGYGPGPSGQEAEGSGLATEDPDDLVETRDSGARGNGQSGKRHDPKDKRGRAALQPIFVLTD